MTSGEAVSDVNLYVRNLCEVEDCISIHYGCRSWPISTKSVSFVVFAVTFVLQPTPLYKIRNLTP